MGNMDPAAEKLFLGVDAGGTKTEFLLAGADGREVARFRREGANAASLGPERAAAILASGAAEAIGGRHLSGAFFGVAGAGVGDNAARLAAALRAALPGVPLEVETDIRCVIEAAEIDGGCVAAILGTGSCVFADDGESLHRYGGWGWLFDGEGSGFDIGREALRLRLAVEDGLAPDGALAAAVGRKLGRRAFDCIPEFQTRGRDAVAAFAPFVFEAVDAGDPAAKQILSRNMARVATLVRAARAAHPAAAAGPLVLGGGLCARADLIGPALSAEIGPDAPKFLFPDRPPVFGALRRASRLFGD